MIELDKIYNEDCLEGMKKIPDHSVDCIICDLPYEVLNKSNKSVQWDKRLSFDELWTQYLRITKPTAAIILFGSGMFTALLMMSQPKLWRYNLIWEKNRGSGFLNSKRMPMRYHEDIAVFYCKQPTYNPQMWKGEPNHARGKNEYNERCYGTVGKNYKDDFSGMKFPRSILTFDKEHNSNNFHPTQKPVALIEYLIKTYSNEGDVILDNCMGSGTTAVACLNTNRHFIGFELNEDYWKKSIERIETVKQQTKLF